MLLPVPLHTFQFTLLDVGYGKTFRPSVVATPYPVTELISAFGAQVIVSVVAVPVAEVVTTEAQALAAIALVPRAEVPLAMV